MTREGETGHDGGGGDIGSSHLVREGPRGGVSSGMVGAVYS